MPVDFSHLNKLSVKAERVADYTIYDIEGAPVLVLAPATEVNKPYFNALLRKSRSAARLAKAARNITAGTIEESRAEDRDLYSKHIVQGWRGVNDSEGNAVEFTEESCLAFLKALPNWIFDDLRNFAADTQNFLDESVDTEEAAKN